MMMKFLILLALAMIVPVSAFATPFENMAIDSQSLKLEFGPDVYDHFQGKFIPDLRAATFFDTNIPDMKLTSYGNGFVFKGSTPAFSMITYAKPVDGKYQMNTYLFLDGEMKKISEEGSLVKEIPKTVIEDTSIPPTATLKLTVQPVLQMWRSNSITVQVCNGVTNPNCINGVRDTIDYVPFEIKITTGDGSKADPLKTIFEQKMDTGKNGYTNIPILLDSRFENNRHYVVTVKTSDDTQSVDFWTSQRNY